MAEKGKLLEKRGSGVLMHISSLPGEFIIGTLGSEAYDFVDFLKKSKQTYWQILPLSPTSFGNSPYQSPSVFAKNEYFIDPRLLYESGFIDKSDFDGFTRRQTQAVDYGLLYSRRRLELSAAYDSFFKRLPDDFDEFCEKNSFWLDDYALFCAVKNLYSGASFHDWDEDIMHRRPFAVQKYKKLCKKDIKITKMLQYLFSVQWKNLKKYANENGIYIIGDMPVYTGEDSADVWASPHLFTIDDNLYPREVAGCPPDYFSENGQLWGNPLYNTKNHKSSGFEWWINRIKSAFESVDVLRIDHFRSFEAYYSVKFGSKTAKNGVWKKGVGIELFNAVKSQLGELDIIAENLGFITPEAQALLDECGFDGMYVLQLMLDSRAEEEFDLGKIKKRSVIYTGTHDNDTLVGFTQTAKEKDIKRAEILFCAKNKDELREKMIEAVMKSRANTCILTMQDLLSLSSRARMNTPSSAEKNWLWRAKSGDIKNESVFEYLAKITKNTNRIAR